MFFHIFMVLAGGGGRPENFSRSGQLGLPTARGGGIWTERLFGIAFEPSWMGFASPTYPKNILGNMEIRLEIGS